MNLIFLKKKKSKSGFSNVFLLIPWTKDVNLMYLGHPKDVQDVL